MIQQEIELSRMDPLQEPLLRPTLSMAFHQQQQRFVSQPLCISSPSPYYHNNASAINSLVYALFDEHFYCMPLVSTSQMVPHSQSTWTSYNSTMAQFFRSSEVSLAKIASAILLLRKGKHNLDKILGQKGDISWSNDYIHEYVNHREKAAIHLMMNSFPELGLTMTVHIGSLEETGLRICRITDNSRTLRSYLRYSRSVLTANINSHFSHFLLCTGVGC